MNPATEIVIAITCIVHSAIALVACVALLKYIAK